MAVNRGKQFETTIKECFEKVPGVSVDRLHDQTTGYVGSSNICDYIVYKYPYEYYIECKAIHGNTLSINSNQPKRLYGHISNKQWEGLTEKSDIPGVFAGIVCWFVDHDTTLWLSIQLLQELKKLGYKSVDYYCSFANEDIPGINKMWTRLSGKKKRVFFDYDVEQFFKEVENGGITSKS